MVSFNEYRPRGGWPRPATHAPASKAIIALEVLLCAAVLAILFYMYSLAAWCDQLQGALCCVCVQERGLARADIYSFKPKGA